MAFVLALIQMSVLREFISAMVMQIVQMPLAHIYAIANRDFMATDYPVLIGVRTRSVRYGRLEMVRLVLAKK